MLPLKRIVKPKEKSTKTTGGGERGQGIEGEHNGSGQRIYVSGRQARRLLLFGSSHR